MSEFLNLDQKILLTLYNADGNPESSDLTVDQLANQLNVSPELVAPRCISLFIRGYIKRSREKPKSDHSSAAYYADWYQRSFSISETGKYEVELNKKSLDESKR